MIGRRFFLKVAGATGLAAACSPAHAPEKLVPLLVPPEHIVPGRPTFYRTICRECGAGCGVTARVREGRVVKLEGNPDDPVSGGALCARGQAALQGLYAPERLRRPVRRGAPALWDEALAALAEAVSKRRAVRILTRPEPGSAGTVQRAFLAALGAPAAARVVVADDSLEPLRAAAVLLHGRRELPVVDLREARSVVSFGADFAETWLSPVELARQFAAARAQAGPQRARLTWVGPRLSPTGANADSWIATRPGGELDVARALLRGLVEPAAGIAPEPNLFAALGPPAPGIDLAAIEHLVRELAARRPSAVLGPGNVSSGESGAGLAAVLLVINHVLGNVGRTLLYGLGTEDAPDPESHRRALLEECAAGQVDALLVHHVDLSRFSGAGTALARVPLVATFGQREDKLAHWSLPDLHALESFGDVTPRRGLTILGQPAMAPRSEARAAAQVLIDLGAKLGLGTMPSGEFRDFARAQAAARAPGADARELFMRGVIVSPARAEPVKLDEAAAVRALGRPVPRPGTGLALAVFPTALAGADPAAVPWLREVPDVLSGLSWSSWAELSPAAAERLGTKDAELLAVRTVAGEVTLPLRVNPALHDEALALPAEAPEARGLRSGMSAQARRAGPAQALLLALGPMTRGQEGRDLARAVSAASPALPPEPPAPSLYPPHEHPQHRWAMAIDLDRCTGCQACVVACYAENNVPVNGPEFAAAGRNMAWLRIQRSFEGGRIAFLPSLCQHCDRAPCEPVCPVYATYHNPEGLNAQVYNRCVGTRYCANNCPYDARVFNWREPTFAPLDLQLNPDVAVRSKGVMEKCTFCVQRIRLAEHETKREGRPLRDGEVVPACAQTCPAQAIVFGDAKDGGSRVSRLREDPRGYDLLSELNTGPAITYLARIEGK